MNATLPMRPCFGPALKRHNVLHLFRRLRRDYITQPKANGHRVLVFVDADGQTHFQNRFGAAYSWRIQNAPALSALPPQTILDGENFHSVFCPFDAIEVAGRDLRGETVEARLNVLRGICDDVGLPWRFDEPDEDWLLAGVEGQLKDWEGLVAKRRGSSYRSPLRPQWESFDWMKLRWGKK